MCFSAISVLYFHLDQREIHQRANRNDLFGKENGIDDAEHSTEAISVWCDTSK